MQQYREAGPTLDGTFEIIPFNKLIRNEAIGFYFTLNVFNKAYDSISNGSLPSVNEFQCQRRDVLYEHLDR